MHPPRRKVDLGCECYHKAEFCTDQPYLPRYSVEQGRKCRDGKGKSRFSLHALRLVAASLFIKQGWPPKRIQTMLGHSSITMTFDVYGHLFHDPAKDADLMGEVGRGLLVA